MSGFLRWIWPWKCGCVMCGCACWVSMSPTLLGSPRASTITLHHSDKVCVKVINTQVTRFSTLQNNIRLRSDRHHWWFSTWIVSGWKVRPAILRVVIVVVSVVRPLRRWCLHSRSSSSMTRFSFQCCEWFCVCTYASNLLMVWIVLAKQKLGSEEPNRMSNFWYDAALAPLRSLSWYSCFEV